MSNKKAGGQFPWMGCGMLAVCKYLCPWCLQCAVCSVQCAVCNVACLQCAVCKYLCKKKRKGSQAWIRVLCRHHIPLCKALPVQIADATVLNEPGTAGGMQREGGQHANVKLFLMA